MTDGESIALISFAAGIRPDIEVTVDQWADEFMEIPKSSGSHEYGPYKTSRTPHARAVMVSLSDIDPCKCVVLMAASQIFKTQVGLNWLCSTIHQSPGNFLWLMPTGKLHKRIAARIDKSIAAVSAITSLVAKPRSRDALNNQDTKEYVGGALIIATAGAAANLSEVPARRVAFDEVDRAEANVGGEGDPIKLAEARQTTFESNRKSYYYSSPTIDGESKIQSLYLTGTQRVALAECVHCGFPQPLAFEKLERSEDGRVAMYPCSECGAYMYESDKTKMFSKGLWSDGMQGNVETESYAISGMFLPYGWFPWSGMIAEYAAAKLELDAGSEEGMITFYNTRLARCWARQKEQTKYDELMNRAEDYRLGTVPIGGLILTASVDVQIDRFELKVVAWGQGLEFWIVDYQVILIPPAEEEGWARLDEMLAVKYRHIKGTELSIYCTFIDSGGTATQEVYNFTSRRRHKRIFAIKGASRPERPILAAKPSFVDYNRRGQIVKKGVQLWYIGTDTAKNYLTRRWKYVTGPGAAHFSNELPEEYYKQLTSEYLSTKFKNGKKVTFWAKKQQDRNEALDLMVYNLAAAYYAGLHKYKEAHWEALRKKVIPDHGEEKEGTTDPAPEEPKPTSRRRRIKRNFATRW